MTHLEERLYSLINAFPDVPIEALKAAMIEGVEAFAFFKDGVQYVGSCGTKRKDAVAEIIKFVDQRSLAASREVPRGE